jgi:hypothetical protein
MSEVRICVCSNEGPKVQAAAEGGFGGIGRIDFGAGFGAVCFGDVCADRFESTIDSSKLVLNVQYNSA